LRLASAGNWTDYSRRDFMGAENKAASKVTEVRGKIKKKAGQAANETGLEAEGRAEEAKGDLSTAADIPAGCQR
jgi:uncharacterized protein YjbJ (UPF0337 family)